MPELSEVRLLLLEAVVDRLTDAGIIDERRLAAAIGDAGDGDVLVRLRELRDARGPVLEPDPGTDDGERGDPLDAAYRDLAALRRLDLIDLERRAPAAPPADATGPRR